MSIKNDCAERMKAFSKSESEDLSSGAIAELAHDHGWSVSEAVRYRVETVHKEASELAHDTIY